MAQSNSMHDIKHQNKRSAKVSPVSCFLKNSFYIHTTSICTSSVDVQLYIRKYLANIAIGSRVIQIEPRAGCRGCELETQWGHKFSGNTAKENPTKFKFS